MKKLIFSIIAVAAIAYTVLDLAGEFDGDYLNYHPKVFNEYAYESQGCESDHHYNLGNVYARLQRDYYRFMSRFSPETSSPEDWYKSYPSQGTVKRLMAHSAELDKVRPLIQRRNAMLASNDPQEYKDERAEYRRESMLEHINDSYVEDLVLALDYFRNGGTQEHLPTEWKSGQIPTRRMIDDDIAFLWPKR
jgi:hypothetical protein